MSDLRLKRVEGNPTPPVRGGYTSVQLTLILSLLRGIRKFNYLKLVVLRTQVVNKLCYKSGFLDSEHKYKVAVAQVPGTKVEDILIYSKKLEDVYPGECELCFKKSKRNIDKVQYRDKWVLGLGDNKMEVVEPFNPIQVMPLIRKIRKLGLRFKHIVNFVLDDTGKKSPEIVETAKACLMPIPLNLREDYQPFNIHAIILTNSGAGKSTIFSRYNGFEPSTSLSEPGLIGGIADGSEVMEGQLNGTGCFAADEFPEMGHQIVDKIMNYCVSGEGRRTLVKSICVKGTKSLVFMGNSELNNLNGSILLKSMTSLSRRESLEAVGRRIPLIIYRNDLNTVRETITDRKVLVKARHVVKEVFNHKPNIIISPLKYADKWLNEDDKINEDIIRGMGKYAKHNKMSELISGMSIGLKKVKFAALKVAIMDNYDMLLLGEKDANKVIHKEAREQYTKFISYIIKSLGFIKEPAIVKLDDLMKESPDKCNGWYIEKLIDAGYKMSEPTFIAHKKKLKLGLPKPL